MKYIILSQKKDFKSDYQDQIFKLYHFPCQYRSRINTGDIFIYNQGQQGSSKGSKVRYYYGTGVIGKIYSLDAGITYFAELRKCKMFYNNVPIKIDEEYIEQIGIENKRTRPNWQSSIRNLSEDAYKTIINMSGGLASVTDDFEIESIKADMKLSIDDFYLNENHQALIDIVSNALSLISKFGVKIH